MRLLILNIWLFNDWRILSDCRLHSCSFIWHIRHQKIKIVFAFLRMNESLVDRLFKKDCQEFNNITLRLFSMIIEYQYRWLSFGKGPDFHYNFNVFINQLSFVFAFSKFAILIPKMIVSFWTCSFNFCNFDCL